MRFLLEWAAGAASLAIADHLLYGFWCNSTETALLAGAALMAVYFLFRPALRFLLGLFNLFTLGLVYALLDAGLIYFITLMFPGKIYYQNFWALLGAAVIVNMVRGAAGLLFGRRRR